MNIQDRVWRIGATVGVLLAVLLAVISVKEIKSIGYIGSNPQETSSITVTGTGDAVAVPDVATFSFSVTETAKTVAEAQAAATAKSNAALKAMRDGGVADKDIQTASYNINPHYEYQSGICTVNICPPSRSILTGYEVSQTIQIKVRDLSKAGTLFTSIGSLGVQNVNGLSFAVDKPDAVEAKARSAAIDDAQAKAAELAKELGVRLVRIVNFSESNNRPGPIMYAAKASMDSQALPPTPEIPAGEQKVTDTVSITYEIR